MIDGRNIHLDARCVGRAGQTYPESVAHGGGGGVCLQGEGRDPREVPTALECSFVGYGRIGAQRCTVFRRAYAMCCAQGVPSVHIKGFRTLTRPTNARHQVVVS